MSRIYPPNLARFPLLITACIRILEYSLSTQVPGLTIEEVAVKVPNALAGRFRVLREWSLSYWDYHDSPTRLQT